jgi:hypothetical protein
MITIAALVLSLKLGALLDRIKVSDPQPTCGITTTSYLFVGAPGTEFRYAGETLLVPQSGSIEMIATGTKTYEVAGRKLTLDVWPADQFGRRRIPLPENAVVRQLASIESFNNASTAMPVVLRKH